MIFGCCPVCTLHIRKNHRILELEDVLRPYIVILQTENSGPRRTGG